MEGSELTPELLYRSKEVCEKQVSTKVSTNLPSVNNMGLYTRQQDFALLTPLVDGYMLTARSG